MRNKVVIFPAPLEEITKGGVHLPKDALRPPIHGLVLETGPEVPDTIKGGDVVVFAQYAGTEVVLEDEKGEERKLLIINDHDIQAKITPTED